VAAALCFSRPVAAATYTFQSPGNTDWTDTSSWSPSGFPLQTTDNAAFPSVTDDLVNVSSSVNVNNLTFSNNSGDYWFQNTSSGSINIYGRISATGNQRTRFYVPIVLQNNIEMTLGGGFTAWTYFNDNVTGSGGITLDGSGQGALILDGGTETYSGNTIVNDGNIATGAVNVMSPNSDYVLNDNSGTTGFTSFITLFGNNQVIGSLSGQQNTEVDLRGATLTTGNANSTTFAGIINDLTTPGSIVKQGSGTFTLTGDNTYSGGTTINSGILNIQNDSALGSGSASVASGAQLQVQGGVAPSNSLTLNGTGGGTGALLNVSGSNNYSGAITLGAATTIGSTSGTLTLSNTNAISGTQNLTFAGAGNTTVSGAIATSTGTLTKNGSGTLTLSGTNTYSGATSLSAGRLNLNANAGLGTSTLTMGADTTLSLGSGVTASNNIVLTGTFGHSYALDVSSGGTATLSGVISNGFFTKTGSNTLVLTNANTYSTGTTISAGALNIQNGSSLGGGPVSVSSGAQLQLQGGITTNPVSSNSLFLNGAGISSTGALLNVSDNNTYSRTVTLQTDSTIGSAAGTLTLSNANSISGAHNLTFTGAGDTTVSGAIATSTGTLTKNGSGKLTLSGTNTYSGVTTVNGGILSVNGSLANSAITVNSGAFLKGSGTIGSTSVGGTLAPGNSINTIHGTSFHLLSGSVLQNEVDASGNSDLVSATSSITIDSGTALQLVAQPGTYTPGQTYTIMSAPSITGTFSSITDSLPAGYSVQINYFADHVDLVIISNTSSIAPFVISAPNTGYGVPSQGYSAMALMVSGCIILLTSFLLLHRDKVTTTFQRYFLRLSQNK